MILIADCILHQGFTAQPQSCGENRRQQPLPPENHDDIGVQKPKLRTPTKKSKKETPLKGFMLVAIHLGLGEYWDVPSPSLTSPVIWSSAK